MRLASKLSTFSNLVTTGLFFLEFLTLFFYSNVVVAIVSFLGCVTAVISSVTAVVERHKMLPRILGAILLSVAITQTAYYALTFDNPAFKNGLLLSLVCACRLCVVSSSLQSTVATGMLESKFRFHDATVASLRDICSRYKIASIATIAIIVLLIHAMTHHESLLTQNRLARQIALQSWQQTFAVTALLSTLGGFDRGTPARRMNKII
tara:strand:+ start:78 stop:701 length:624 start_codon:yes stop_codon:yes gene_type:complete